MKGRRMKGNRFPLLMIFLLMMGFSILPCMSDKEVYQSASGEKRLPEWRVIAKARERYGPYIRWKESLIKSLVSGSRVINTGKGPVEYAIHGNTGPYLLIMHGAPGGYDQAAALFSDMFARGFRILSWSRPGYIRTPLNDGKTYDEQADAALALLDALGIERVAVLGYSAGGPPAVYFASRYPERTWGLILECAVTRKWALSSENIEERIYFGYLMYNDPFLWASDIAGSHTPRLIGMSTVEMESSLDRKETAKLMDHILSDPRRVDVLTGLMKSMSPAELRKTGMENDVNQLGKIRDLPLKHIHAPTLIIHGTRDADVPVSDAEFAAAEIPGARLYLVPGGFHVMALADSAEAITEERLNFLEAHAPQNH